MKRDYEVNIDINELLSEVDGVDLETISVFRQMGSTLVPLRLRQERIDWNGRMIRAGSLNHDMMMNVSYAIYDLKDKYGFIVVIPFDSNNISIFNDNSCELATTNGVLIQAITQKKIPLFYNQKIEALIIPVLILRIIRDNLSLINNH